MGTCGDSSSRWLTKILLYGFEILKICFKHALLPPLLILDDALEMRPLRVGLVIYTAVMFAWFFLVYVFVSSRVATASPVWRILSLWVLVPILCVISETLLVAAIFALL